MIKKTKDYTLFKFKKDNRPIDKNHLKRLRDSIQSKNLLEYRPIIINTDFEIIDGQHRLECAKTLGTYIYYQVQESENQNDVILMNISKSWGARDYLNFYYKNHYPEYVKLHNFIVEHDLILPVALKITIGSSIEKMHEFKIGNYKFTHDINDSIVKMCQNTILEIKKMNGYSPYLKSGRFWKSLIKLFSHGNFDEKIWKTNVEKLSSRFSCKGTQKDYDEMLKTVYNWRNSNKIDSIE